MTDMQGLQRQIPFPVDNQNGDEPHTDPGIVHMMLDWIVPSSSSPPPHWSRSRDKWLRWFWRENGPLKTAVNTFVAKAISIPFRVQARDHSIASHVEQAIRFENALRHNSGAIGVGPGKGFKNAFKSFLIDVLTVDNGGFMLVMGGGPANGPIVGRPAGLIHLDAGRCTRTSNPEFPVIYFHTDDRFYRLHYTRVITLANLPSPEADLNGVGLCAVSCCIEAAMELWDIYRYSSEKFGSRPPRQVFYAETGATIQSLRQAIQRWQAKLDSQNQSHFGGTLVVAPTTSSQTLKLHTLSLTSAPDNFDRQQIMMQDKAEIAASFGLDLLDLAMSFGLQGQTRANADVQSKKGRGKGVGELLESFALLMNEYYLPEHLTLSFDNLDDDQDEQRAEIRNTRSEARERDLRAGVTTPRVERERMWEAGELSVEQFEDMELADGRLPSGLDVLLLFSSADVQMKAWLNLPFEDPTNVDKHEPEQILPAIHDLSMAVSEFINTSTSPPQARKARQALAALERLRALYEGKQEAAMLDEQAQLEAESEGAGEPVPEETAPEDEDLSKATTIRPGGWDRPLPDIPLSIPLGEQAVKRISDEFDRENSGWEGILDT